MSHFTWSRLSWEGLLYLWLLRWLQVTIAAKISSTEPIKFTASTGSSLAATAVTAAYAIAAANQLLGK